MATTTKIVDMETICNNVRNITDRFLEEMNKFLDQQRQIPLSNPIQLEKTTPTLSTFDTKISPNFAPTDASKGSLDGITSAPIPEMPRKAPIPPQQWLQLAATEPS